MEILNNVQISEEIWAESGRAPRNPIYDTIADQEEGTTIVLERGVDIPDLEDMNISRQRLISAMRWRGIRVRTKVDGDILYVLVLGTEVNGNGQTH